MGLTVSLSPIGPGSTYALSCSPTGVSGTGYATTRSFTCKNPDALSVNVYAVQATLTSDYYQATQYEDVVTVYDFHATILHLLGLDHEVLTYLHNGRDERLTDVAGKVVKEILA